MSDDAWLRLYLQDHAAVMAAARSLLQHNVDRHGSDEVRAALAGMVPQFDEDRVRLHDTMTAVGAEHSLVKETSAVLGKHLERHTPHRRESHRSPLSDVVDMEALTLALTATALGWSTLVAVAQDDHRIDEAGIRAALDRTLANRRQVENFRMRCIDAILHRPALG